MGRCNSFFDPDCDGSQEGFSNDEFQDRMRVLEADLAEDANPGARYFMEGWYVVCDDVNIFNTMGWRELDPNWTDSFWTFPATTSLTQGSFADFWVDAQLPGANESNTVVDTGEGLARVMVKVVDLEDDTWRYDYAVMNHGFMRAHLIHHPAYCGAASPRVRDVSLGRASSTYRRVRFRCSRSRNAPTTGPVGPSLRHDGE